MFSSPTPAPGSRALATNAFRSAGLMDKDTRMRDAEKDKQGGRKGTQKHRSHRPRPIDSYKVDSLGAIGSSSSSGSSSRTVATRMRSDPLAIRGSAAGKAIGGRTRSAAPVSSRLALAGKSKSVDAWRQFVHSRWNPDTRFLNLERMDDDEYLKKNNLPSPASPSNMREAMVMFKVAGQLKPPVQTLSLAGNRLESGDFLKLIDRYLPKIANLSLQDNKIKHQRDLDGLSQKKGRLLNLRELIMSGNPIREDPIRLGQYEKYKSDMTRRFLTLELMDGEAVSAISFDVPKPAADDERVVTTAPPSKTFPSEMCPSFITGVDNAVIGNFLMRFFPMFDTQRAGLLDVYDPASTFSFSCNTSIPPRAKVQRQHTSLPNQRKLEWGPWLPGSRNLGRIANHSSANMDKLVQTMHVGAQDIIKAFANMPLTKHDLGTSADKFVVDAFPTMHGSGMGLLVMIHGEFAEAPSEGIRSFDRTFMLAPAPEGSRAKANGWDVLIMSDMYVVRGYSHHSAWAPGPMHVGPEGPPSTKQPASVTAAPRSGLPAKPLPVSESAALNQIPEPQKSMVLQVSQRSGLNIKFSVDCLTGNEWNVDKAMINFEQVKGTLPPTAFY